MVSRFSSSALAGFELLFRPWMHRRLRGIRIAGLPDHLPDDLPLLLASNHTSWWDPFALREVHRALRPTAPVHTLMLRRELDRHPWFRLLGAIGIDPDAPATVAHAIRQLQRIRRKRPDHLLLFFPQGRIWPSYRRPLGFQRGVELFARKLAPIYLLPAGLHVEALNTAAPTLFVSLAPPRLVEHEGVSAKELERCVEAELDRLHAFLARHGEDAPAAWPSDGKFLPPEGRQAEGGRSATLPV